MTQSKNKEIIAVIGAQWGDEGKGKIVDWLSEEADVIVRFQGGHNAGHTLVIGEKVFKLSLLPSGIVREGKFSIIGNGVVVDPHALISEIEQVQAKGVKISPDSLAIAENACMILSLHRNADLAAEKKKGLTKIGTTGRGIGPAYEDKIGRRAIRFCDLFDVEYLKTKVQNLVDFHNLTKQATNDNPASYDEVLEEILSIRDFVLPYIKPVWKILDEFHQQGKRILFEGAQGVLLDIDHGTYPFVTSSNTISANSFIGSGFGVKAINTLGIVKAYTTRVGSGPFPTEENNDIGNKLGERGHEFGTVTGRKRRCGWLDGVLLSQSIKVSGINNIVLTKLDVLDDFDTIKICTSYDIDGKEYDYLPSLATMQEKAKPNYIELAGWKGQITAGVTEYEKLPETAKRYIEKIEELTGVPVSVISTGADRRDTIRR